MKITPANIFNEIFYQKAHKARTEGKNFDEILSRLLENAPTSKSQPVAPLENISKKNLETLPQSLNELVIEKLEKFLSIMEEYHRELSDPLFSLKDISPLIKSIEIENESLINYLNLLPDEEGIKKILNQALITSSVEIIKFNRGDYLFP